MRGITNTSSGKMGFALAQAAAEAGADRHARQRADVAGDARRASRGSTSSAPRRWPTAVDANLDGVDAFIAVAAVADYTPAAPAASKIKKTDAPLTIALQADGRHPRARSPRGRDAPYCVGFAAETDDVERNADEKRRRKKLPLIVANRAQDAFGSDDNEVTLFDDAGAHPLPRMGKLALARRLVAEIARAAAGANLKVAT